MKTNINNEATELQNEQTLYSTVPPQYPAHSADTDRQPTVSPAAQSTQSTVRNSGGHATNALGGSKGGSSKASLAKRMAIGAGAGLVLGGVAAAVMSMRSGSDAVTTTAGSEVDPEVATEVDPEVAPEADPEVETSTNNDLHAIGVCDGDVAVASGVSDDMSFSQAFAEARAEVGPGGVFEWRGQLYGTYTADEWNSMSPEQQQDYYDHFNWDRIDAPSDVADQPQVEQPQVEQPQVDQPQVEQPTTIDDDITVETNDDELHPFTMTEDSEVEVLGVVHDEDTGYNRADISVDGQQAILVDVDGDMQFDYIQADFDGDGQIASDEYVGFGDQGPSVSDLGGFSDGYEPTDDDPIDNSDQIYDDI